MKSVSSLLLFVIGLCLVLGGFAYDLAFAGIPYQDPTPAMSADYARHAQIASVIRWAGVAGILLAGAVAGIRFFVRK